MNSTSFSRLWQRIRLRKSGRNQRVQKPRGVAELCNTELEKRRKGLPGEGTVEQLEEIILPELYRLQKDVSAKRFPPKESRYIYSFACAFTVWGWNMQKPSELFILLKELNDDYKKI